MLLLDKAMAEAQEVMFMRRETAAYVLFKSSK